MGEGGANQAERRSRLSDRSDVNLFSDDVGMARVACGFLDGCKKCRAKVGRVPLRYGRVCVAA
jgi:hypothetical protein